MRAAQILELGRPPEVGAVADPEGATIEIEAVALNPLDLAVARGAFYGGHPPLPYVPGCEAVGRTVDGRLVYVFGEGRGVQRDGFLTERVAVPEDLPVPLPGGIEPAVAAAAGIAGIAAWVPVVWRARVAPDDRVLVLGATGTVGRIAAQVARSRGAHVVGAARTPTEGVVALDDVGDAFPDGFTVCIDPLWGEPLARALAHAAPHARIVHLGQSAGAESPLASADVRGKELTIIGHSNFALSAPDRSRAYLELVDEIIAGRISVEIERFGLDDVAAAWRRQGESAKAVVTL